MTGFELWETRSRNLIADYDTEAAALAEVWAGMRAHGPEYADSLMLVRVGPRGGLTTVASGRDLSARALAAQAPKPKRVSA